MGPIIAIDPGRDKCGVAIVSREGTLWRKVIPRKDLEQIVEACRQRWKDVARIVIGDGTGSKEVFQELRDLGLAVELVDEYGTTEEARKLYWKENKRKGWRKLVPVSLQTPPEPYDDLVAVVLGQRYWLQLEMKVNGRD
ncbi:MAG: hypothetical protein ACOYD6_04110 [Limnochordia bacterium]|jgi:RNase H-fold protein (predicted Holliday junction resolvase)